MGDRRPFRRGGGVWAAAAVVCAPYDPGTARRAMRRAGYRGRRFVPLPARDVGGRVFAFMWIMAGSVRPDAQEYAYLI